MLFITYGQLRPLIDSFQAVLENCVVVVGVLLCFSSCFPNSDEKCIHTSNDGNTRSWPLPFSLIGNAWGEIRVDKKKEQTPNASHHIRIDNCVCINRCVYLMLKMCKDLCFGYIISSESVAEWTHCHHFVVFFLAYFSSYSIEHNSRTKPKKKEKRPRMVIEWKCSNDQAYKQCAIENRGKSNADKP